MAGKPRLAAAELSTTTDTAIEAGAGEGLASDEPNAPEEEEGEEAEGASAEPPELRSSPAPALLPEEDPLAALALPAEARESPRPLPSELLSAAAPFAEGAAVEASAVPAPSEVAPVSSLTDAASPKAPSVPAPSLSAPSSPPNPPAKRLWVEDASPSGKAPPVPGRIPGATSKSNESVRPAKEMAPRAAPAKSRSSFSCAFFSGSVGHRGAGLADRARGPGVWGRGRLERSCERGAAQGPAPIGSGWARGCVGRFIRHDRRLPPGACGRLERGRALRPGRRWKAARAWRREPGWCLRRRARCRRLHLYRCPCG